MNSIESQCAMIITRINETFIRNKGFKQQQQSFWYEDLVMTHSHNVFRENKGEVDVINCRFPYWLLSKLLNRVFIKIEVENYKVKSLLFTYNGDGTVELAASICNKAFKKAIEATVTTSDKPLYQIIAEQDDTDFSDLRDLIHKVTTM